MKKEYLKKSQVKFTFNVTIEEYNLAKESFKNDNKEQDLKELALNKIFQDKFNEVILDEEVSKKIIGYPKADVVEFNEDKDIIISLTVDLYPEFDLPKYKGIEVNKVDVNVTDEEVDALINGLLAQSNTLVTKEEQVIENGDYAVFDFLGTVNDVPFDGGAAENYEMQIGSGQFIPGFEDQMIGMKKGEVKDVKVTFPENYTEELKGKDANFKVTVHEVKVKVIPTLNDEFVASLGVENVKTVNELKEYKKEELNAKKAQEGANKQLDTILDTIVSNTNVELPDSLIADAINSFKAQYENQAKQYGIPFEVFLQYMGINEEKFNAVAIENATKQVKFTLVAAKIMEIEKLNPTHEEVVEFAKEEAKYQNTDVDTFLKQAGDRVYSFLAQQKLFKFLVDNKVEL